MGGRFDTDATEVAVQPHHHPSRSAVVTTAMPVGQLRMASCTDTGYTVAVEITTPALNSDDSLCS
jgi:hypothetical protein